MRLVYRLKKRVGTFRMDTLRKFTQWLFGEGWGAFTLAVITLALAVLLHSAASLVPTNYPDVTNALREFSRILFTVVILQIVTRSWLWKNAIDTFYERLKIKDAITNTGLLDFWWFPDVPWQDLFKSSQEVEVVAIASGNLFTGKDVGLVKEFLARANTRMQVVLADPRNEEMMRSYDDQFNHPSGDRRRKVEASARELRSMSEAAGAADRVSLRFSSRLPKYSFYRFGEKYLFVPYLTVTQRSPERIPVFCFGPGALVEKYLTHDLLFVKASAVAGEVSSEA